MSWSFTTFFKNVLLTFLCLSSSYGVEQKLNATAIRGSSIVGLSALTDNQSTTTWTAPTDVAGQTGATITFDLGSSVSLNGCRLEPSSLGRTVTIELSSNGSTWTKVRNIIPCGLTQGVIPSPINSGNLTFVGTWGSQSHRYVRLTVSVIAGEAPGFHEVTFFSNTQYDDQRQRRITLGQQVDALTTDISSQPSQAVLYWMLDRSLLHIRAGYDATSILDIVQNRINTNWIIPVAQQAPQPYFPPYPGGDQNPFVISAYNKFNTDRQNTLLLSDAVALPTGYFERGQELTDPRNSADICKNTITIVGHDASGSRQHDVKAIRTALLAMDAVLDQAGSTNIDPLDYFAKSSVATAMLLWEKRYPGVIPSIIQDERIDILHAMGTIEANRTKTYTRIGNVNQEALKWWAMTAMAELTGDANLLTVSNLRLPQFGAVMFPDGAFPYSGNGGEANEYQDVGMQQLYYNYILRGSQESRKIIESTLAYYPLMCRRGPMAEWNTSHIAKDRWNGVSGSNGAYMVASLTGSSDNYRIAVDGNPFVPDLLWAPLYRTDLVRTDEPDRWVTFDRNIRGGRGRFGDVSFWVNGNTNHQTNSLAGCMVLDPSVNSGFTCNAAVAGIGAYVRTGEGPTVTTANHEDNMSWYGAENGKVNTITTHSWCSISSRHDISQGLYLGSEPGWETGEVWIASPRGLIGLMKTSTTAPSTSYGAGMMVKLFSRRTAGTRKLWNSLGNNTWDYGLLRVSIHETSFLNADITTDYSWCHTWDGTNNGLGAGRLLLRDAAAHAADDAATNATPATLVSYPAGSSRYALLEITMNGVTASDHVVVEHQRADGLQGFEYQVSSQGLRHYVLHNPTSRTIHVDSDLRSWNAPITVHQSGETFRANWLDKLTVSHVDARGPLPSTHISAQLFTEGFISIDIPANSHIIMERAGQITETPVNVTLNATTIPAVLTWSGETPSVNGILIERQRDGVWTTISTVLPGRGFYQDNGYVSGDNYQISFQSVDGISSSTIAVVGNTQITAPTAPTGFVAVSVRPGTVRLSWDAVTMASSITLERSSVSESGPWVLLTSENSNSRSYNDTTAPIDTNIFYRITTVGPSASSSPMVITCSSPSSWTTLGTSLSGSTSIPEVVDNDLSTQWTSSSGNNDITILFNPSRFASIERAVINWDIAPNSISLSTSLDGITFTPVLSSVTGIGLTWNLPISSTVSRYLRLSWSGTAILNEVYAYGHAIPVVTWPEGQVKADNAINLDNNGSWSSGTVPSNSLAVWKGPLSTASALASVGSGISTSGVLLNGTLPPVVIGSSSGSLGLGNQGITTTDTASTLTIQCPTVINAPQTWTTGSLSSGSAAQVIINGSITGSSAITISGDRPVKIAGSQGATGSWVFDGGTLQTASAGSLGSGSLVFGSSHDSTIIGLAPSGTNWNNPITLSSGSGLARLASTMTSFGGNIFSGSITGTSDLHIGIPWTGSPGVVALSGDARGWTGNLIVDEGILKLALGSQFNTISSLIIDTPAAVDLNASGSSWTFAGIMDGTRGGGTIRNAGGARTLILGNSSSFSGSITGNIVISVTGGRHILTGNSSTVGNTGNKTAIQVTNGILALGSVSDGGQPSSWGSSDTTASNIILINGGLEYQGSLSGSTNHLFRIGAAIAGTTGSLVANGLSGASWVWSSPSPITWGTTNQTRNLILDGSNLDANTLSLAITNNGTGVVSVTKQGTGRWILNGSNTWTGPTIIKAGVLAIGNVSGISSSSDITVKSGAVLDVMGQSMTVKSLTIETGGSVISSTGPATITAGSTPISLSKTSLVWQEGTLVMKTCNGQPQPLTVQVLGNPTAAVTVSYQAYDQDPSISGSMAIGSSTSTPPVHPQWYLVSAFMTDFPAIQSTARLQILPQDITITAPSQTVTWTGQPFTWTPTTSSPLGVLETTWTPWSGDPSLGGQATGITSTTIPTELGWYSAAISVSGDGSGQATSLVHIIPEPVTISLTPSRSVVEVGQNSIPVITTTPSYVTLLTWVPMTNDPDAGGVPSGDNIWTSVPNVVGWYKVVATVVDPHGQGTAYGSLQVTPVPGSPDITLDVLNPISLTGTSIDIPWSVTTHDNSTPTTTWSVNTSSLSPTISGTTSPTHIVFHEAGTYEIILSVTDAGGRLSSKSTTVNAISTPTSGALTGPSTMDKGSTVSISSSVYDQFSKASNGDITWSIEGSGTLTPHGHQVDCTSSTVGTVVIRATAQNYTNSITITVNETSSGNGNGGSTSGNGTSSGGGSGGGCGIGGGIACLLSAFLIFSRGRRLSFRS